MSNLINSKENNVRQDRFSILTTWGSFLGSRDHYGIQQLTGSLDNLDQNKNIIFIFKIFTSVPLRYPPKEEMSVNGREVKTFEPYVEQKQIQGELPAKLKPLSVGYVSATKSGSRRGANRAYGSYSDLSKSKKYFLLQSLLMTQSSPAATLLTTQKTVTKEFHDTNLRASGRKVLEAWGRNSSSFKNVSFLTYWLLPFMSLVPFAAARSTEQYGGVHSSNLISISQTNELIDRNFINDALEDSPQTSRNQGLKDAEGSGATSSLAQNFYLKKAILSSNSSEGQSSQAKLSHYIKPTTLQAAGAPRSNLKTPAEALNTNSKDTLSRSRSIDQTFTLLTNSNSQTAPSSGYQKANYNYVPLKTSTGDTNITNLPLTNLKSNIGLGLNFKVIQRPRSEPSSKTENLQLENNFKQNSFQKPLSGQSTTYQNYLKYIRQKLLHVKGPIFSLKQNNFTTSTKIWVKTEGLFANRLTEAAHYKFKTTLTHARGSSAVQPKSMLAANSINIVLNQKKLYMINSGTEGHFKLLNDATLTHRGDVESKSKQDGSFSYFLQKKEIEKKRKAKKLRLESRRQKKRKRFYPRPTWLRLRLKLDSVRQAGALPSQQILKKNEFVGTSFFEPSAQKAQIEYKKEKQTRWNKALSLTAYNKFLYNLAFSIKDSLNSYTTNLEAPKASSQPKAGLNFHVDNKIGPSLKDHMNNNHTKSNAQTPDSIRNVKQNLTSKYKVENQKLAEFLYTRKLELTRKSVGKIKSKSNYINFEPKSANQTIPKKETNSSFYRDFWLWLYNTTSTNKYNKTLLLDSFLTQMSVPLTIQGKTSSKGLNLWLPAQLSNKNSLIIVPWAINKTNLQTTTNKRLSLWSIQKLRNQSKNNKTKWIQKQIQTKVNNFLSPSILKDIWTKTGQNQTGSNYSLETQGILKKSLIFKIRQKIHQKEQKLGYLVNKVYPQHLSGYYLNNLSTLRSSSSGAEAHKRDLTTTQEMSNSRGFMVRQSQSQSLYPKGEAAQSKASTNLTWWDNLSSLSSFKDLESVDIFNNLIEPTALKTNNSKILNNTVWLGLLVHFCALISLISISQIRCFLKFHFILIHKLSNSYLTILYKITNSLSGFLTQKEPNLFNFGSMGRRTADFGSKNIQAGSSLFAKNKKQNVLLSRKFLKPKALTNSLMAKLRDKKDSREFLAHPLKLIKLSNDKAQVISSYSSNSKNLRVLFKKQNLVLKAFAPSLSSTDLSKLKSLQSERERVSNFQNQWVNMSPNLQSSNYKNLLTQTVKIQTLAQQNEFAQLARFFTKTSKKSVLDSGFKVVDTFESCLRLIYGFFEKPAEFTMDWIAYAFLVEWSSDLLSFTPQKTETQNWLAFSKIIRQTNVGFVWYGNALNTNPLALFPTILLTQFISKRFLYLNDLFLSVLYKPDTDLLIRQKKGTLFWDIWSDFLIKAADKYNINIPSLSNIKEEQNVLLENFLADTSFKSSPNVRNTGSGSSSLLETLSSLSPKNSYLIVGDHAKYPKQVLLNRNLLRSGSSSVFEDEPQRGRETDQSFAKRFNLSNHNNGLDGQNVAQQFITYQSKETELFLDYNAPKSFNSLSSIKYYSLIQQPLGTIVCQIYSGLLTQQIAKNILVIGSTLSSNSKSGSSAFENSQKTLLIQALAGETEIKMITDNASRYAIVNRGFAVGIKYLKEVFDAITLNTPCLFLLEDIHLIGERRPQLISDHGDSVGSSDGMNKSIDAAFGSARSGDAVHEKNQIYYQLSRHAITHYKKPFKGDFSLAIPTNHFSFDLFLKSRPNNFINNPSSAFLNHPLSHGINIFDPEQKVDKANQGAHLNTKLTSKRSLGALPGSNVTKEKLSTSELLKLSNNTLLAPPSTSPFSVLLLKEQKKLKATKIVKEIPWVGLPTEQLSLLPRVSYSVRAKVSALAELGFTNMSAKLDMITDLLVIIDSVRSHRGFVVFATTHLPHLLDPALRRPGRLDETISIPTISNLWTRWEFSKSSINSIYLNSVDNSYFGSLTHRFKEWGGGRSSADYQNIKINTKYLTNGVTGYVGTYTMLDFFNLDFATNLNNNFFSPIANNFTKIAKNQILSSTLGLPTFERPNAKFSKKVSHIAYYQMGKKLLSTSGVFGMSKAYQGGIPTAIFKVSNLTPTYLNPTTSDSTNSLSEINEIILNYGPESLKYKSFYSSPRNIQNILIGLMSGKFTELFAFKVFPIMCAPRICTTNSKLNSTQTLTNTNLFTSHENVLPSPLNPINSNNFDNYKTKLQQNFISLYGIDETWRAATSFALSFVQKRYLFNKNLIVPKLLNLGNFSSLEEAPSPPAANILIPAKRYENYKKSFKENVKALRAEFKLAGLTSSNLQSKLQNHMKQAFIKNIYANLNQTNKTSALVSEEYLKTANNSLLKLAAADFNRTLFIQSTNASSFYENKIYYRHRLSLNNQWWTAQLTEHSAETLFLSDIDWRYTFIGGLEGQHQDSNSRERGAPQTKKSGNNFTLGAFEKLKANQNTFFKKLGSNLLTNLNNSVDTSKLQKSASIESYLNILIDFPDADQLYNPKQRRWTITSGYWSSWFNLDKNLQNEIFDSLIFESVMNIYEILNNNREMLDYSAAKFMKKGLIKESEITNLLKSFSTTSTTESPLHHLA